jgi:hypothetical protein
MISLRENKQNDLLGTKIAKGEEFSSGKFQRNEL